MNEFENNVNPQTEEPDVQAEPAAAEEQTDVPQLTVEPEIPEMPEMPEPPAFTAPPQAPQQETGTHTVPNFTQPPQYTAPQFNGQFNGQPYQQPFGAPQPNFGRQLYNTPPAGYAQKSRLAAGLLAMMFGMFGVHNFYLGYNSRATIQLVVTLVGIVLSLLFVGIFAVLGIYVWAFIEGVQLISGAPGHMYDGNGVITKE